MTGPAAPTALVLVSHSRTLAEGVRELAAQMAGPGVPILIAAGLEDGSLGTDAAAILSTLEAALEQAREAVVLFDLGSAYLNTATALDLLPEEKRGRVVLADAPLAEGAVIAAVAASVGDGAAAVRERAEEARGMRKVPEEPVPPAEGSR
ncbi:dihydroxyacetone kinase phosphoryl donor subunit DhaM [Thermaerobacter subterraneus]|uniref:phosphoenolpyruvate--glycerone phosphotransferase n=1 Tax=Thermaerobacter subterraneus DSM 13965 TaxID=867903 RepID=K6PRB5_9FIRM|nr:dihydroxyacetone kinase phosphoryl donor subunit DhaM [Thermaerobacter subterraneus]EKP95477.1 dihydroxyacetone kinase DhaM subunit [Thermaerobacter subterraneus DSM 13965]